MGDTDLFPPPTGGGRVGLPRAANSNKLAYIVLTFMIINLLSTISFTDSAFCTQHFLYGFRTF